MSKAPSHSFITRSGQEEFLSKELHSHYPNALIEHVGDGLVTCSGVEAIQGPLLFSRQLLPNSTPIHAISVREWVDAIFKHLKEHFGSSPSPWALFVSSPSTADTGEPGARPLLIRGELEKRLKEKQRSYLRTLQETPLDDATLVQVCLSSSECGVISFCSAEMRQRLPASLMHPSPGGYVDIPDDKAPPSRAFKKLLEAQQVFGLSFERGAACVDLGASPGGWTHVLVQSGCNVTAIDRSPLSPSLMRHKRVRFETGNALSWTPPQPVNWLVCDVITTPDRTAALIRRWVEERLCSHLCVTVKFKGEPAMSVLLELCDYLKSHTAWFDGKQLTNNKNELTVVAKAGFKNT